MFPTCAALAPIATVVPSRRVREIRPANRCSKSLAIIGKRALWANCQRRPDRGTLKLCATEAASRSCSVVLVGFVNTTPFARFQLKVAYLGTFWGQDWLGAGSARLVGNRSDHERTGPGADRCSLCIVERYSCHVSLSNSGSGGGAHPADERPRARRGRRLGGRSHDARARETVCVDAVRLNTRRRVVYRRCL